MTSDFQEVAKELEKRNKAKTAESEAKAAKREQEHRQKQRQKFIKKRNQFLEKLIAPLLLILTVAISLLVMFLT